MVDLKKRSTKVQIFLKNHPPPSLEKLLDPRLPSSQKKSRHHISFFLPRKFFKIFLKKFLKRQWNWKTAGKTKINNITGQTTLCILAHASVQGHKDRAGSLAEKLETIFPSLIWSITRFVYTGVPKSLFPRADYQHSPSNTVWKQLSLLSSSRRALVKTN